MGLLSFIFGKKKFPQTPNQTVEFNHASSSPLDHYTDLSNQFNRFRITTMTKKEFYQFYSIGVSMLEIIPNYMMSVWKTEKSLKLSHSSFHKNIPEKLLDYCCRFGEWDMGRRIFPYLDNKNIYGVQFPRSLIKSFHSRERSVSLISRFLNQNGETSKVDVIRNHPNEKKEDLQWAMRYYKGFSSRKEGSKYFVSLCDIK